MTPLCSSVRFWWIRETWVIENLSCCFVSLEAVLKGGRSAAAVWGGNSFRLSGEMQIKKVFMGLNIKK